MTSVAKGPPKKAKSKGAIAKAKATGAKKSKKDGGKKQKAKEENGGKAKPKRKSVKKAPQGKLAKRSRSHYRCGDVTKAILGSKANIEDLDTEDLPKDLKSKMQKLKSGHLQGHGSNLEDEMPPKTIKVGAACAGYLSEGIAMDSWVNLEIKSSPPTHLLASQCGRASHIGMQ